MLMRCILFQCSLSLAEGAAAAAAGFGLKRGAAKKKKHCIGGWCLFEEQQHCDDVQIACRQWEHCRARRWRWVKSAMCRRVEEEEEERLALLLRESPQGWRPVLTALLVSIARKM